MKNILWIVKRFPFLSIVVGLLTYIIIVRECSESELRKQSEITKKTQERQADEIRRANIVKWGSNYKYRMDSSAKAEKAYSDKTDELAQRKRYGERVYKIKIKHPDWNWDECERVSKHLIWIGMSYEMLVYIRGKPDYINTSNYGNGNQYQACWTDYDPRCFYFGEDHIVTSYN